jgi:(2Fe-2S) ferredoxin
MDRIRSIQDLEAARLEAFKQETASAKECLYQIRVSMGTCSIGVGASETLAAIRDFIESNGLQGVRTKTIGCIGLCALEPIVQVVESDRQTVTYGKVTPAVVQRIFKEHIQKHIVVQEYVVDNI